MLSVLWGASLARKLFSIALRLPIHDPRTTLLGPLSVHEGVVKSFAGLDRTRHKNSKWIIFYAEKLMKEGRKEEEKQIRLLFLEFWNRRESNHLLGFGSSLWSLGTSSWFPWWRLWGTSSRLCVPWTRIRHFQLQGRSDWFRSVRSPASLDWWTASIGRNLRCLRSEIIINNF